MGVPLPGSNKSIAPATPAANPGSSQASGQLPYNDAANTGWTGSFTAVGVSKSFVLYGGFNVVLYPSVNQTLTTTNASSSASVGSATGVAIGQTIVSANVPPGTIVANLSGTTVTLGFPPGYTNADVTSGVDSAALFIGPSTAASLTVALERSFDGGVTWITAGVGGGGVPASYAFSSTTITDSVCIPVSEYEKNVAYRLACRAYTSGTMNYRISTTGTLAGSLGIPGP